MVYISAAIYRGMVHPRDSHPWSATRGGTELLGCDGGSPRCTNSQRTKCHTVTRLKKENIKEKEWKMEVWISRSIWKFERK